MQLWGVPNTSKLDQPHFIIMLFMDAKVCIWITIALLIVCIWLIAFDMIYKGLYVYFLFYFLHDKIQCTISNNFVENFESLWKRRNVLQNCQYLCDNQFIQVQTFYSPMQVLLSVDYSCETNRGFKSNMPYYAFSSTNFSAILEAANWGFCISLTRDHV